MNNADAYVNRPSMNNEYSPKRSSMWLAPAWCRSPANGQCFNRKITHFVCMCTYCDCDPRHSGCNSDKVPSAENIKYRSLSEDPLRKSVQQTVRDWTGAGKHSDQRDLSIFSSPVRDADLQQMDECFNRKINILYACALLWLWSKTFWMQ